MDTVPFWATCETACTSDVADVLYILFLLGTPAMANTGPIRLLGGANSSHIYLIILVNFTCNPQCQNYGACISQNTCRCRYGFMGATCEIRTYKAHLNFRSDSHYIRFFSFLRICWLM
jgi:hypothetical protein